MKKILTPFGWQTLNEAQEQSRVPFPGRKPKSSDHGAMADWHDEHASWNRAEAAHFRSRPAEDHWQANGWDRIADEHEKQAELHRKKADAYERKRSKKLLEEWEDEGVGMSKSQRRGIATARDGSLAARKSSQFDKRTVSGNLRRQGSYSPKNKDEVSESEKENPNWHSRESIRLGNLADSFWEKNKQTHGIIASKWSHYHHLKSLGENPPEPTDRKLRP